MGTQSHIAQWGASLAVRVPKPLAEEWGDRAGSAIEMITDGELLTQTKRASQPAFALVHRAWWANDFKHTHAQVWLEAGWRAGHVIRVAAWSTLSAPVNANESAESRS